MPNQRTFQVQGLTTNGVAVGGLASLSIDPNYSVLAADAAGAIGTDDVDRHSLDVNVSLDVTDVAKVNAILDATPGITTFSGKESGAATWHNYTLGAIVFSGFNLNLRKDADATLSLNGKARFAAAADTLDDWILLTGAGAVAPTLTYPARLYRPNTASFDPDGAGAAVAPLHVESMTLAMAAQMLQDSNDADIGMTAVDRGPWQNLVTTLMHRDAKAVSPSHIAAQLLGLVRGVLTVSLLGRGGAANKEVTVNNLLWTGASQRESANYSEFSMRGNSGWKNGATTYALNSGTKLFSIV